MKISKHAYTRLAIALNQFKGNYFYLFNGRDLFLKEDAQVSTIETERMLKIWTRKISESKHF